MTNSFRSSSLSENSFLKKYGPPRPASMNITAEERQATLLYRVLVSMWAGQAAAEGGASLQISRLVMT
jgi:hypothetical protein